MIRIINISCVLSLLASTAFANTHDRGWGAKSCSAFFSNYEIAPPAGKRELETQLLEWSFGHWTAQNKKASSSPRKDLSSIEGADVLGLIQAICRIRDTRSVGDVVEEIYDFYLEPLPPSVGA